MTGIDPAAAALLREWLPANDDPARPVMQLATVDADGRPDVRSVLLSAWDEEGFAFHTDARSRKAEQLADRTDAALAVVLPGRQLTVQGRVEPAGQGRDEEAYARRSPYLRRLAWVNTMALAQSEAVRRAEEWRRFGDQRLDADLTPPSTWAGFLVRPVRLTFWSADVEGPSHRVEHRRVADGWTVHHLAG